MNKFKLGILLFVFSVQLSAQTEQLVSIGKIFNLDSEVLNEERAIKIYLPESYNNSSFAYPVVYLLDAEYEFHHTTGAINFMSGTGTMPEMIVVGITNINRSRDLTPPAPNDKENEQFWGEIGGAENFRSFIQKELIPHINQNYRTVGYNILRGQSFGGLFGLADLTDDMPIFNAYILTSPTVRWNESFLFKKLEDLTWKDKDKTKIYIGEAEFDSGLNTGIRQFSQLLSSKINDLNYFNYEFFKNESHYSLVHIATINGLKFIFKNYPLPILKSPGYNLEELKLHFSNLSKELGYTINTPMNEIIRLANNKLRQRDFTSAISIAKNNVGLYPNQPETYWHVGDAYNLDGDFPNALTYFKLALQKAKYMQIKDLSEYEKSVTEARKKDIK